MLIEFYERSPPPWINSSIWLTPDRATKSSRNQLQIGSTLNKSRFDEVAQLQQHRSNLFLHERASHKHQQCRGARIESRRAAAGGSALEWLRRNNNNTCTRLLRVKERAALAPSSQQQTDAEPKSILRLTVNQWLCARMRLENTQSTKQEWQTCCVNARQWRRCATASQEHNTAFACSNHCLDW